MDAAPPADAYPLPVGPALRFDGACRPGARFTVAAVGDTILHAPLLRQVLESPDGYDSLWADVAPVIGRADVAYANFEGPSAPGVDAHGDAVADSGETLGGDVYSGSPPFNFFPSLVPALMGAGFDVVSTANNHALDRGALGVDRTIETLRTHGLPFTGTRRRGEGPVWITYTESGGLRVAWLACSFSMNLWDEHHQTLECDDDLGVIEDRVAALAASPEVDAVIVTPHGGDEFSDTPAERQVTFARAVLHAGALAVIGNHPHVVQPWERIETDDGRETFVAYSLGNFVSAMASLETRASIILYLGLTRADDGRVALNGVRYLPILMEEDPWRIVPAADSAASDADEAMELIGARLEPGNQLRPDEPLVTNPECGVP